MLHGNQPVVVIDESSVEARLQALDLSSQILLNALQAGIGALALCTRDHPPVYRGAVLWGETMYSLRNQLAPQKWVRDDTANFSTVLRQDKKIGIAVATGNPGAGMEFNSPTTGRKRGPITRQFVERNATIPYLPFDPPIRDENIKTAIWFLLHRRDNKIMRSELSFPIAIDGSGYITDWGERIILPIITLDHDTVVPNEDFVSPRVVIERK